MVTYDIRCSRDHVFEAWFSDSSAFEAQAKAGEVVCPVCGDVCVARAPMAPAVATGKGASEQRRQVMAQAMRTMTNMQDFIKKNADDVGGRFAEEARKIHYGEADPHNIYGRASVNEANEMRDEGIEFGELPWPVRGDA